MPRKWTDETLIEAVKRSTSVNGVFKYLGLRVGGGSHQIIKERIKALKLDTTHFTGQAWSKGMTLKGHPVHPLDEILIINSTYQNTVHLKTRLLKESRIINKCAECGCEPVWRGKQLVLRLDHINGKRNDNRIENLRLLCPNCDSQQPTFCGRNIRKSKLPL